MRFDTEEMRKKEGTGSWETTSSSGQRTIQRNVAVVVISKMVAAVITAPVVTNVHVQLCKF